MKTQRKPESAPNFIAGVRLNRDRVEHWDRFPFLLPAVRHIEALRFETPVTILAGENGSGKSTILESIAVLAGFGSGGGSKGHTVAADDDLELSDALSLVRNDRREKDGYFLRAENFLNVAKDIPLEYRKFYGGDLARVSHGESFMALVTRRFGDRSNLNLFFMDEPESALSPSKQLEMLIRMKTLVDAGSQFIVATYSPILMAYPGATIYWLSEQGIERTAWEQTDHYMITKRMLQERDGMFKWLGF